MDVRLSKGVDGEKGKQDNEESASVNWGEYDINTIYKITICVFVSWNG